MDRNKDYVIRAQMRRCVGRFINPTDTAGDCPARANRLDPAIGLAFVRRIPGRRPIRRPEGSSRTRRSSQQTGGYPGK